MDTIYDTLQVLIVVYYATGDSMLNPASGGASVGVWGRYPSAISLRLTESVNSTLICVHLRLIFVSLNDRIREIQFKLFPIINENLNIQHFSEVYQENSLVKSPQNIQKAQMSVLSECSVVMGSMFLPATRKVV